MTTTKNTMSSSSSSSAPSSSSSNSSLTSRRIKDVILVISTTLLVFLLLRESYQLTEHCSARSRTSTISMDMDMDTAPGGGRGGFSHQRGTARNGVATTSIYYDSPTTSNHERLNEPLPPLPFMPKNVASALKMILHARRGEEEEEEGYDDGEAPSTSTASNTTTTTTTTASVDKKSNKGFQKKRRATFLQIGANDGQMFDPLYPHMKDHKDKWIGLLVEPQPNLYSQLAVLHADAPHWSFYHGAVVLDKGKLIAIGGGNHEHRNGTTAGSTTSTSTTSAASPYCPCQNGVIEFCETKTPGEGDWRTQGQINKIPTIPNNCNKNPDMHLQRRPCVTSLDLLLYQHAGSEFLKHTMKTTTLSQSGNKNNNNSKYINIYYHHDDDDDDKEQRSYTIDFLQIDVEGKDYEILQMLNFDFDSDNNNNNNNDKEKPQQQQQQVLMRPTCIHYENVHLPPVQRTAAQTLLTNQGYTVLEEAMDVLACQVGLQV